MAKFPKWPFKVVWKDRDNRTRSNLFQDIQSARRFKYYIGKAFHVRASIIKK